MRPKTQPCGTTQCQSSAQQHHFMTNTWNAVYCISQKQAKCRMIKDWALLYIYAYVSNWQLSHCHAFTLHVNTIKHGNTVQSSFFLESRNLNVFSSKCFQTSPTEKKQRFFGETTAAMSLQPSLKIKPLQAVQNANSMLKRLLPEAPERSLNIHE